MSADGLTIVGEGEFSDIPGDYTRRAFRWTVATGVERLGPNPFENSDTFVLGATEDVQAVLGYALVNGLTRRAFVWNDQGFVMIPQLPGCVEGYALTATRDGSTVGGYGHTVANAAKAWIWSATRGIQDASAYLQEHGVAVPTGTLLKVLHGMSTNGEVMLFTGEIPGMPDGPILARLCYANCDTSTAVPILNINDFNCFLNRFSAGNLAANCDGSTAPPMLNVNDFNCFLNTFATGCT